MNIPDVTGLPLTKAQELLTLQGFKIALKYSAAPRRKTPVPHAPVRRVVRQRNLKDDMSELVVCDFEGSSECHRA